MKPRLYNARKVGTMVQGPVYIGRPSEWGNPFEVGRPSEWGNPFEVGRDGTREEVIQKHREWFLGQPELVERARRELRGQDLLCWCAPRKCHGEVLLEVANSTVDDGPSTLDEGRWTEADCQSAHSSNHLPQPRG